MTDAAQQHYATTNTPVAISRKRRIALGHETTFTYDANGNRASQTVKRTNAQGQLETIHHHLRIRQAESPEEDDLCRWFIYSSGIQRDRPEERDNRSKLGRRTEYTYDDMGRLTRTTYPDGKHEEATYDAEGRG